MSWTHSLLKWHFPKTLDQTSSPKHIRQPKALKPNNSNRINNCQIVLPKSTTYHQTASPSRPETNTSIISAKQWNSPPKSWFTEHENQRKDIKRSNDKIPLITNGPILETSPANKPHHQSKPVRTHTVSIGARNREGLENQWQTSKAEPK